TVKLSLSAVAVVIGPPAAVASAFNVIRSEERRVGKEGGTPFSADELPRTVTVPVPESFAKATDNVESAPSLTVLPAASSIVAVTVRAAPEARSVVNPDSTTFAAAPCTTLKLSLSAVAVVIGPPAAVASAFNVI